MGSPEPPGLQRTFSEEYLDPLFLNGDGQPQLVECAVLFVDILGVRAMNTAELAGPSLVRIEAALSRMHRRFVDPESPWPAAMFSDTLVLASPVMKEDRESAVGGLVDQAAWLQLNLTVGNGIFIRGSLAIGDFYIRNGIIFGPALVEAYELESRTAVVPRVVLSSDAEAVMKEAMSFYAEPSLSPEALQLRRDPDGRAFVNYLANLWDDPDEDAPAALQEHRSVIVSALQEHTTDRRVWEKYRWVADYHDWFCRTHGLGGDLLIDGPDIRRDFRDFDP